MFRLTRIFESPAEHHYFFGYFNTPQVSADSQRILALRVKTIDAIPGPSDTAEVGWFSLSTDSNCFHKIGETKLVCRKKSRNKQIGYSEIFELMENLHLKDSFFKV